MEYLQSKGFDTVIVKWTMRVRVAKVAQECPWSFEGICGDTTYLETFVKQSSLRDFPLL